MTTRLGPLVVWQEYDQVFEYEYNVETKNGSSSYSCRRRDVVKVAIMQSTCILRVYSIDTDSFMLAAYCHLT